eukprot:4165593-Amphidinium_carterae.1
MRAVVKFILSSRQLLRSPCTRDNPPKAYKDRAYRNEHVPGRVWTAMKFGFKDTVRYREAFFQGKYGEAKRHLK